MSRKSKKEVVSSVETVEPIDLTTVVITDGVLDPVITTEVVVEPVEDVVEETTQPSLLASILNQEVKPLEVKKEDKPTTIKVDKNQGVGAYVRRLIGEGMSNKDILKLVHEQYGNQNTTYACVAWYRNKMKKTAVEKAKSTAQNQVQSFLNGEPSTEQ